MDSDGKSDNQRPRQALAYLGKLHERVGEYPPQKQRPPLAEHLRGHDQNFADELP